MNTRDFMSIGVLALFIGLAGCEREVSFAKDVQPVLQSNCVSCHDQAAEGISESGLSLVDYDSVMRGTKFGAVVVPESSESSALYMVLAHKTDPSIQMPPHHQGALAEGRGAPLNEDQVAMIRRWIDQGARNN